MPANTHLIADLGHPDAIRRKAAILTLGRSGDPDALLALGEVERNDPDPELRVLAAQARSQIRRQVYGPEEDAPRPAARASRTDPNRRLAVFPGRDTFESELAEVEETSPEAASPGRGLLLQALDLYAQNRRIEAAKKLRQALDVDSSLKTDASAMNLAAQITGLPPQAAVEGFLARTRLPSASATKTGTMPRSQPRRSGWGLRIVVFGLALALVAVGAYLVISADLIGTVRGVLYTLEWPGRMETKQLGVYPYTSYFVVAPSGEPPPRGWPVLVAVHGAGGTGFELLSLFAPQTLKEGVLLVAPYFTSSLEGFAYEEARDGMNAILDEVWADYDVDTRAPVMFGFSAGGVFASYYAWEYSGQLNGVAIAGAPFFGEPSPKHEMYYLITVGALDEREVEARAFANRLSAEGYRVTWEVIPDAAHTISARQVELTMDLVDRVYGR